MTPEELLKRLLEEAAATPARLAAEPAAPQLAALLSTLHGGRASLPSSLCSRVRAEKLCGTGNICVRACTAAGLEEAWLPLHPPPDGYRYPVRLWNSMRTAALSLARLSANGLPPVYHDYRDPLTGRRCEPRIGCRVTRPGKVLDEGAELRLGFYKPIVYTPVTLTWHAWRLSKPRRMNLPWIALCRPGLCQRVLCPEPGGCSFYYDPRKPLLVIEAGKAVVDTSTGPGGVQAYTDTMLAPVYREIERVEVAKPSIWIMGVAIPIAASVEHKENRVLKTRLLLWNPSRLPSRSTVLVRGYRIRSARLVSAGDTQLVQPLFDRANIVLAGHTLTVLELLMARTLFL